MVVGGAPERVSEHAGLVADFAIDMVAASRGLTIRSIGSEIQVWWMPSFTFFPKIKIETIR